MIICALVLIIIAMSLCGRVPLNNRPPVAIDKVSDAGPEAFGHRPKTYASEASEASEAREAGVEPWGSPRSTTQALSGIESSFKFTDVGQHFLNSEKPTTLSQLMPSSWSTGVPSSQDDHDGDPPITAERAWRSAKLTGVIRQPESTRTNMSRIIGPGDPVREAFFQKTPLTLTGDFVFNDADQRQRILAGAQ